MLYLSQWFVQKDKHVSYYIPTSFNWILPDNVWNCRFSSKQVSTYFRGWKHMLTILTHIITQCTSVVWLY